MRGAPWRRARASSIEAMPAANIAPAITFSTTVMAGKGCTTWKVRAMPRAEIWNGFRRWIGSPLCRISPELAGCTPVMMLTSVLLPAPLGPIRPTIWPGSSVSETL